MSLRIRRGTEAQRPSATFDLGEIVYTTDTNKLYVGDGVNLGGKNILATSAGLGLAWNPTTQRLDFNGSGTGILAVSADTSPTLGGNLNLNTRNITGTGDINITGTITATQFVGTRVSADISPTLGGNLNLDTRNITGTGNINITGTITATQFVGTRVSVDTSPTLGGNLTLGGFNISGNGNISIASGNISLTSGSLSATVINATAIAMTGPAGFSGQAFSITNPQVSFVNTNPTSPGGWVSFLSTSSTAAAAGVNFAKSRGGVLSPAPVQNNDVLGQLGWLGWTGSAFTPAASIRVNAIGTISSGVLPTSLAISVNNSAGAITEVITASATSVNCNVPLIVPIYATTTTRDAAITAPTPGMIIFLTATTKFQGYAGGTWADLN